MGANSSHTEAQRDIQRHRLEVSTAYQRLEALRIHAARVVAMLEKTAESASVACSADAATAVAGDIIAARRHVAHLEAAQRQLMAAERALARGCAAREVENALVTVGRVIARVNGASSLATLDSAARNVSAQVETMHARTEIADNVLEDLSDAACCGEEVEQLAESLRRRAIDQSMPRPRDTLPGPVLVARAAGERNAVGSQLPRAPTGQ